MFFVWMNTPKGSMPQWWSEDLTLNQVTGKDVAAKVISKHKLTAKEADLSLEECIKLFPRPPEKNLPE